ncbi:MAG: RsbRD N-terminal domain-containing protein [Desulfobaccales bacterium]
MKLLLLLSERKVRLTERWQQRLFESYPAETATFLKKEKDRFGNPVGQRLSQGLRELVQAFLAEMDRDQVLAGLDEILRIRAIQDFTPSQALAFIFLLKNVIREELAPELKSGQYSQELQELEARIDGLALLGFDVYTQRRELLNQVRVDEIRGRVSGLLRRTGLSL